MSICIGAVCIGRRQFQLESDSIEAVAKAIDVLQVFLDRKRESLSFTEINDAVHLNKNAVFRLLYTLTEKGLLSKAPDSRKYSLSPKCIELGRNARLSNSLRRVALPFKQELWRRFDDTVNFAVLEHTQISYVEVLESPHRFKLVASPGDRDPVHSTALGKAMLAHLSEKEVRRIIQSSGMPRITSSTITSVPRYSRSWRRFGAADMPSTKGRWWKARAVWRRRF